MTIPRLTSITSVNIVCIDSLRFWFVNSGSPSNFRGIHVNQQLCFLFWVIVDDPVTVEVVDSLYSLVC